MVKCAIFDLDGTLINTIEDLGDAGNYTLKHYGIDDAWSYDDYKYMVGNGNRKLVERVFRGRIPAEQLEEAYRVFMEYYDRNKLNKTRPYDGIKDAIDTIKEKGIQVAVCTNKVQASAIGILDYFFGENYFDAIIGQVDGVPTKPDPAMPRRALDALGCTAQEAVYFSSMNCSRKSRLSSLTIRPTFPNCFKFAMRTCRIFGGKKF